MRPCVGRATRVDRDRRVPFLVALGDHGFFPAVASRRVRCRRVAFRARFRRRGLRVLAGCRVGRVRRVPIACGRHGVDRRRDDRDRRVDRRLPGGTNGSCRVARVRVSSGASVQGGALRACPRISAFHGPLRAVPEAVHLGTFERAVVHSALVDHSFSPLSSRVLAFASHSATRVAIVEIVRVEKYSRVSVRSRSSRRSGRQKLMDRRFSSSASGCCVRRRFVATFGRLNHRDLRVFVGCRVDRAHRVPIQPWSLR